MKKKLTAIIVALMVGLGFGIQSEASGYKLVGNDPITLTTYYKTKSTKTHSVQNKVKLTTTAHKATKKHSNVARLYIDVYKVKDGKETLIKSYSETGNMITKDQTHVFDVGSKKTTIKVKYWGDYQGSFRSKIYDW